MHTYCPTKSGLQLNKLDESLSKLAAFAISRTQNYLPEPHIKVGTPSAKNISLRRSSNYSPTPRSGAPKKDEEWSQAGSLCEVQVKTLCMALKPPNSCFDQGMRDGPPQKENILPPKGIQMD